MSAAQPITGAAATTRTHAPQNICMSQSANFVQTITLPTIMPPYAQAPDWLAVVPPEVPSGE